MSVQMKPVMVARCRATNRHSSESSKAKSPTRIVPARVTDSSAASACLTGTAGGAIQLTVCTNCIAAVPILHNFHTHAHIHYEHYLWRKNHSFNELKSSR